jgi:hypothetical protein
MDLWRKSPDIAKELSLVDLQIDFVAQLVSELACLAYAGRAAAENREDYLFCGKQQGKLDQNKLGRVASGT